MPRWAEPASRLSRIKGFGCSPVRPARFDWRCRACDRYGAGGHRPDAFRPRPGKVRLPQLAASLSVFDRLASDDVRLRRFCRYRLALRLSACRGRPEVSLHTASMARLTPLGISPINRFEAPERL